MSTSSKSRNQQLVENTKQEVLSSQSEQHDHNQFEETELGDLDIDVETVDRLSEQDHTEGMSPQDHIEGISQQDHIEGMSPQDHDFLPIPTDYIIRQQQIASYQN